MPWLDAAWQEPAWIDAPVVAFDVRDRGLLLGDGVFDTALLIGKTVIWRDQHVQRLQHWCDRLGFPIQRERLERGLAAIIEHASGEAVVRTTVTRGSGQRGIAPPIDPHPTILMTVAPLPADMLFAPVSLRTVATRRNQTSPLSRIKSLNYGDAVLAAVEARATGADEPLFLNCSGQVACTGIGNIFAVFGDRIVTPPLEDGAVAGIARSQILAHGPRCGLNVSEERLDASDLDAAAALFMTNSLRCIARVTALDGRAFAPDAIVRRIALLFAGLLAGATGQPPDSFAARAAM